MIGDLFITLAVELYDLTLGFLPAVDDISMSDAIDGNSIPQWFFISMVGVVRVLNALPFISLFWPWIVAIVSFWGLIVAYNAGVMAVKFLRG